MLTITITTMFSNFIFGALPSKIGGSLLSRVTARPLLHAILTMSETALVVKTKEVITTIVFEK